MIQYHRIMVTLTLLLFLINTGLAQSDYEITQDFKYEYKLIESAIDSANSMDELDEAEKLTQELMDKYIVSKELLDKALYPENFKTLILQLNKKRMDAEDVLYQKELLDSKVKKLESDITILSKELESKTLLIQELTFYNKLLLAELELIRRDTTGEKDSLARMTALIDELHYNIQQRDNLIFEIADSLLFNKKHELKTLNDAEKKGMLSKIKSYDLLNNVQYYIVDNIKFLRASELSPSILNDLKSAEIEFTNHWNSIGTKIVSIYTSQKQLAGQLVEIDTLITEWNLTIDKKIWNSIEEIFQSDNLDIKKFSTGNEFYKNVTEFIDDGIKNTHGKSDIVQYNKSVFFERAWNENIIPDWMPLLLTNNLISLDQKKNIDSKLSEWNSEVDESNSIVTYLGIIMLIILLIGGWSAFSRRKKSTTQQ